MIRLGISVEGETEESFVNNVLAEHLRTRGVVVTPVLLGGDVTVQRLASDMAKAYWISDCVTSLVDFYGFRNKGAANPDQLEQAIVEEIGHNMECSWDPSRVFPYVQMHEFEGLLFSDVTAFAVIPNVSQNLIEVLRKIRSSFLTPEDINDSRNTAPSKRIDSIIPRYHKVAFGPLVAAEIGLDTIRSECPRFQAWLTRLESLASPSSTQ